MATTPTLTVNADLKSLHGDLVALVASLDAAVGRARTAPEVIVLLDEISDVTARVNNVGRQLFTQQTKQISESVAKLIDSKAEALTAVERFENAKAIVVSVTKFLGAVDKIVDGAKLVA